MTFGLFAHKNRVSVVDTFLKHEEFTPKLSERESLEYA